MKYRLFDHEMFSGFLPVSRFYAMMSSSASLSKRSSTKSCHKEEKG